VQARRPARRRHRRGRRAGEVVRHRRVERLRERRARSHRERSRTQRRGAPVIDFRFVAPELRRIDETGAEVIACGVYRDTRPLTGLAGLLDWRMAGRLSKLAKQGFLLGEVGEVLVVPARPRLTFDKLLAFGLGPRGSFADATFRKVLERV